MSACDQLSMFEPDSIEASALLRGYLDKAKRHCALADRFEFLGMRGAVREQEHLASEAVKNASTLAFYLDLLWEAQA